MHWENSLLRVSNIMRCMLVCLVFLYYSRTYATTKRTELNEDAKVNENMQRLYNEEDIVYQGQYDIVKIYSPIFLLIIQKQIIFFVVEAEKNKDSTISKGLYVVKNNITTKLLDNGIDVDGDTSGNVYFAASDGVYKYDRINNVAIKFSSLSESIISIAAENGTSVIYALNANHVLYRITTNDIEVNIDDRIKDAEDIAIDIRTNSLFYYNINKTAYVLSNGIIKTIQGFPKNPSHIQMTKPPIFLEGMAFLIDYNLYIAFTNGTSTIMGDSNNNTQYKKYRPTALAMEAGILVYYGYDKKVYCYNLVKKILSN